MKYYITKISINYLFKLYSAIRFKTLLLYFLIEIQFEVNNIDFHTNDCNINNTFSNYYQNNLIFSIF